MWRWAWGLVAISTWVAGCARKPPLYADYALTASPVMRHDVPAEFPSPLIVTEDPEIQGAHPLEFYVDMALERNPELQAARRSLAAQAQVIPQVTALDDPMLSNSIWPAPRHAPQTTMGRMPYGMMVSQQFPWFGKLRMRGEMAEAEVQMAFARLAETELGVIENVRLAYHEVNYNQRAREITGHNRELLADLIEIAEARYRTGEASQQDVLRAQLELDRVDQRLIEIDQALRESQADLASLLQADPDADLLAAPELEELSTPGEIDRLYEIAIQCRPELQERLASIVRDQRNEELKRLDYYPDVTLGFGWDVMTMDRAMDPLSDGFDTYGVTVGLNLPIWRERLRAGVGEARHRVVESSRRYDASRNDTFRQIRRYTVQARALDEQRGLFRDRMVPRAEQTLRVSIADYRVGRVSVLQLIDNWLQLLTFELQLARIEASRLQALASLERAVGCALTDFSDSDTSTPETEVESAEPVSGSPASPAMAPEPIPSENVPG
jgi:outer membrane protein, heavy metal efflux system